MRSTLPIGVHASGECPLWVISGHVRRRKQCLLTPKGDIAGNRSPLKPTNKPRNNT